MSWGLFIHMEENSALISNFFHQPAASQPAANYTKHRAQTSTQRLKHCFRAFLWFPFGFMVTFLWSSLLKVRSMSCPSWELPWEKSAKHASSRIWSPMLRQSCGASVLKHFENVSLNRRLLYIAWLHFEHFLGQSVGAIHLKESFSRSFHFENLRSAIKHNILEQKKLTLEGLPAGNWKRVQNRHMFRKQRILRMKIKTHSFAQFSCSSELNVQGYLQYNKDFA